MKPTLRKGFTTGTAAAAAAKAATILAFTGHLPNEVKVTLPEALRTLDIKIHKASHHHGINGRSAASVIKDGGDDPDATSGLEIIAAMSLINTQPSRYGGAEVIIKGGDGVGIVTKAGLQVPVGAHAINPVPLSMIRTAVREAVPSGLIEVEIIVPEGQKAAQKTFNSRLGIIGGISIIGTTGIVEPMSVEAIKSAITCELDVAYEENSSTVYLSPGKIGEESLKSIFHGVHVVQMSNFIGDSLQYAMTKGFKKAVIGGHPGKLAKLLMGYFDTHSGNSPQATGFVAGYFGLEGEYNTVEEIIEYMQNTKKFDAMAYDIAVKIRALYGFSSVGVYLFNMKKQPIGAAACTRYW
ncbi:cobalt-precorrin-5B (C(1))-methyltransferase CbiD [Candidatus Magnetominusculus xianensis]|uniref:Cobalt-precorrin-5B C(1)-methyltransferase n=1 Tax=Candidatus Magnetominusculus xianensis TaxID=1748249 RepID=A0ABR5SJK9_9BACT|nr:cobalt-precorrin-5B (C(1))-methyltransferase CbiD [Candidatus Magnetominusculus xianensis]KWT94656.1 cobalamin biosynthesis protein CbiD [Candidatus Magnetominusculus xianensis]MBF0403368.1 cobalamin biosynthesis protein CbiD [Nitrospirota bacterium]